MKAFLLCLSPGMARVFNIHLMSKYNLAVSPEILKFWGSLYDASALYRVNGECPQNVPSPKALTHVPYFIASSPANYICLSRTLLSWSSVTLLPPDYAGWEYRRGK